VRRFFQSLWRRRAVRLGLALLVVASLWKIGPYLLGPFRRQLGAGISSSVAVHAEDGRLLRLTLASDQQYRKWTPLSKIAPELVEAVLLYEDRSFRWHPGVNPLALLRGAWSSYGPGGGRRLGGSTITMQLARRLYHLRSSTFGGKLRQLGRALQLELLHTKREILEAYLNLVSFGGNIEGVGAASLIYFGKSPDRLTLAESLSLAVIPQNPCRRGPRGLTLPPAVQARRNALLETWRRKHPGSSEAAALGALPIALQGPQQLPFEAPHLTDRLVRERRAGETELRTSLDLELQRLLDRHLHSYLERRRAEGLRNAAALLVEAATVQVLAAVGSADFFDRSISGQVDGTRARRSPGSTLKPFVYGLAFEQGLLHPRTLLKDGPTAYADYRPENFDRLFLGPLTAEQALTRSRNIPALALAEQLKPDLHDLLSRAGVRGLRPAGHYGLALALGGAELSLEELGALYAALQNGGVHRPLRLRPDDPLAEGRRLLGAEAAFVTLEMLRGSPRPGAAPAIAAGRAPRVAWKTGTSHGFHDAWTVGVVGPYVLAVWLGNFSGEANPALVGNSAAAPLFFELVDSLAAHGRLRAPVPKPPPSGTAAAKPLEVRRLEVCAESGHLPGPHCKHLHHTWYWPGRSPIATCQVHRAVTVEERSGLRACDGFKGRTRTEVFEFWPSDLGALFELAGQPRRLPPPPGKSCGLAASGARPRILSPVRGVTYLVDQSDPSRARIALSAATDADAPVVHWFVDSAYLGRAPSGTPFWWQASPGSHLLRAVDAVGRSDSRRIRVELARR
jgi:penicillin-binding protein 1C